MVKIGFVIPTAYNRPEYLPLAYESIKSQSGEFHLELIVGCPEDKIGLVSAALPDDAVVISEPASPGLASKLDGLLRALPKDCKYIAWLGDDDLLTPGSLQSAVAAMEADSSISMVYGGCDYIDANGKVIFNNPSGQWAARILNFGPQLIPQPGSLMRAKHFFSMPGLSNRFALAFDFDLFLNLKAQGPLVHIPKTLAQFRWHPTSLSVKRRMTSALEASRVRRSHYAGLAKVLWVLWEPLVIIATWAAGKLVSIRTRRLVK